MLMAEEVAVTPVDKNACCAFARFGWYFHGNGKEVLKC